MTTDLVDSEEGAAVARHAARALRASRRSGRRGHLPALRPSRLFLGQTLNPNAGGVHAVRGDLASARQSSWSEDGNTLRDRWLRRRPCLAAALHRRARNGFQGDGPPARPDDGAGRRHRRLRRRGFSQLGLPGMHRGRSAATSATSRGSARWSRTTSSRRTRSRRACCPADARDRRRTAGLVDARRTGHVRDPRQTGGKQNRARPRTSSRSSRCAAASGCSSTRSRSMSRSSGARPPTRTATSTMEGEAIQAEMLAMAMAARNSGGIVIAQVRQLAPRGSLP